MNLIIGTSLTYSGYIKDKSHCCVVHVICIVELFFEPIILNLKH